MAVKPLGYFCRHKYYLNATIITKALFVLLTNDYLRRNIISTGNSRYT
jgi:hypothetical protein